MYGWLQPEVSPHAATPCRTWFRARKTVIQTQSSPLWPINLVSCPPEIIPRFPSYLSPLKKNIPPAWMVAHGSMPRQDDYRRRRVSQRVRPSAPVRCLPCMHIHVCPAGLQPLLNSSQLHPSLLFLLTTRSPPTRSWQTTQACRPIFPVARIGESDSEPGSSRCVCARARAHAPGCFLTSDLASPHFFSLMKCPYHTRRWALVRSFAT
ncbi:uncharacterized protein LY79DRAFT_202935 [Colletotrichum navitas]|uniref:Uncharacterized protein n=1 Tax=Colletotrichum navitas TaxID=681940 RepID=A0AAD8QDB0_9PEZI|nr:uncharacterized protein LY79DRAFT_202935 [Colletotrichum navitas]KAK1598904.1 hypothetical protein LY79DRAFT_202935 [Colletotrichum navitas]